MAGPLAGRAVRDVAAGLDFTVAVTVDGSVWQMGALGASGKAQKWEACCLPEQAWHT